MNAQKFRVAAVRSPHTEKMFSTVRRYNSRSVSGDDRRGGDGREVSSSEEDTIGELRQKYWEEHGNQSDLNMTHTGDPARSLAHIWVLAHLISLAAAF
jgi:hypothetical protein